MPIVRIRAPQITAIQKLRSCGSAAVDEGTDIVPLNLQAGFVNRCICTFSLIRAYAPIGKGSRNDRLPVWRMRAMQKEPSPTPDRTACNCLALRQAARHISQIYDSYLASEGLRTTQFSILAKLNRLGPLSINELAKSMVMDRTTLGRAIRPLQRDRLLTIGEGEDGQRAGGSQPRARRG